MFSSSYSSAGKGAGVPLDRPPAYSPQQAMWRSWESLQLLIREYHIAKRNPTGPSMGFINCHSRPRLWRWRFLQLNILTMRLLLRRPRVPSIQSPRPMRSVRILCLWLQVGSFRRQCDIVSCTTAEIIAPTIKRTLPMLQEPEGDVHESVRSFEFEYRRLEESCRLPMQYTTCRSCCKQYCTVCTCFAPMERNMSGATGTPIEHWLTLSHFLVSSEVDVPELRYVPVL